MNLKENEIMENAISIKEDDLKKYKKYISLNTGFRNKLKGFNEYRSVKIIVNLIIMYKISDYIYPKFADFVVFSVWYVLFSLSML